MSTSLTPSSVHQLRSKSRTACSCSVRATATACLAGTTNTSIPHGLPVRRPAGTPEARAVNFATVDDRCGPPSSCGLPSAPRPECTQDVIDGRTGEVDLGPCARDHRGAGTDPVARSRPNRLEAPPGTAAHDELRERGSGQLSEWQRGLPRWTAAP